MAKNNFYPEGLPSLLLWLQLQLVQWAAKYQLFGYTADEAQAIAKRIQAVIDKAGKVVALQASLAQEIKERDQLTSDFEAYYRDLIQRARRTPGLDAGVPDAFKWNGTEKTPPNPDTTCPSVTNIHNLPGEIELDWIRAGFEGVDVELSYDGQTWEKGDFDTRSPYEDRCPNQTPGQPETRYYRLRYRYQGEPFGQYSAVAQATASGN
jgi:hypothetical protein